MSVKSFRSVALAVTLLCAVSVAAQHNAKIGFAPGIPTGTQSLATGFKLYRVLCSGPLDTSIPPKCPVALEVLPFVNVAAATCTLSPAQCTDATVVGNTNYSYYVTGTNPNAVPTESVPSVHIGVVIPPDSAPPPPTNLGIVSVAMNNFFWFTTVTATWVDNSGMPTTWQLKDSVTSKIIAFGNVADTNYDGKSSMKWWGWHLSRRPILKICDSVGCVSAQI